MKDRTFTILLFSVVAVCALLTIAHFAWAAYAYKHSSIIYFIGRELW